MLKSTIVINPAKYNLDITGLKDNTTAFQKMINSFPDGTTLVLSQGKYLIKTAVTLKDDMTLKTLDNNVTIIGSGTNILFTTGNNNSFDNINFENCGTAINEFQKSGLNVTRCGFRNNISYAAINFYGSTKSNVMDSHFNDVRKYGVLIDADSAYISIENNNFENPTRFGGYTTPQIGGHVYCLNGNNITVNNNILNNSGGQGVIFCYNSTTGKGTTKSSMFGNTCKGNGQEGATVYGGSNKVTSGNSVKNNTCIDNRFDQIEIWQSDKNTVENNTVAEPNHDNGNLGAICLYDTTGTTCTGNKVLSAQSNGIDITAGSSNCIVSENFIKDTDRSKDVSTPEKGNGILLDSNAIADPQYITITNNKISSSSGTIAKSGVYSTSNTDHHNKISGNVITGYEYGVHPYALETCGN